MRSRKGILPGLCKSKKSPFNKNGNNDEKYDVVIKYDDKGNMMHPKDWDPNYKSRFDIPHGVDTTGVKEFEKWIKIKKGSK